MPASKSSLSFGSDLVLCSGWARSARLKEAVLGRISIPAWGMRTQRDLSWNSAALLCRVNTLPQLMMQRRWLIAFHILKADSVSLLIAALTVSEWTAASSEMSLWEEANISLKWHSSMLCVNNQSRTDMLDVIIKMILLCNTKDIFKEERLQSHKTMLEGLCALTSLRINNCQGNSKFSIFSNYSIIAPQDALGCLVPTSPGKRSRGGLHQELPPKQPFVCSSVQKHSTVGVAKKVARASPLEFEGCSLHGEEFIGHLTAVCSALKGWINSNELEQLMLYLFISYSGMGK